MRYTVTVRGAGDRHIPVDFSLTPIRNERDEEVTLIIPEGRDISEIEQARTEKLRTQLYRERLSIGLRVAKAAAWTWDVHTDRLVWTPEFENLFDYEPGTTKELYSEWFDRIHPDDSRPSKDETPGNHRSPITRISVRIPNRVARWRNSLDGCCRRTALR